MKRNIFLSVIIFSVVLILNDSLAHCDSIEGPVVKASQKALETGNINYVLVWVRAEDEQEIKQCLTK